MPAVSQIPTAALAESAQQSGKQLWPLLDLQHLHSPLASGGWLPVPGLGFPASQEPHGASVPLSV